MMMVPLLFLFLILVESQYYDIESDTVFAPESSTSQDVPYRRIHASNMRASVFYDKVMAMATPMNEIQCHHYKDFYTLLYTLCRNSTLCSEMYYLGGGGGSSESSVSGTKVDFKKFVYQLSLEQLFLIKDDGIIDDDNPSSSSSSHQLFLLEDNMPIEWIPRYVIRVGKIATTASPCHESVNLSAPENSDFVHSTLYLLHAYKYYVVNDYKCGHYNEWLVLDAQNKPRCICRHNKSCETESNYRVVIIILTTLMLMAIVLWIVSFFVHTPKLIQKMDEINRLRG